MNICTQVSFDKVQRQLMEKGLYFQQIMLEYVLFFLFFAGIF